MDRQDELTSQQRASLVTLEFLWRGRATNARIRELTGLGRSGAWRLIGLLAVILPIVYDENAQEWVYGCLGSNTSMIE